LFFAHLFLSLLVRVFLKVQRRFVGMTMQQEDEISVCSPPQIQLGRSFVEERALTSAQPITGGSQFLEPRSNEEIAPCLSVVMPVYNEEATVAEIAKHVLEQRPVQELIIVDDCSTDGTWHKLQGLNDARVKLLRHERNCGKGAALRTGFQHTSATVVIVQDADSEYNPREYYLVLNPIVSGKADVVFGSRFIGAGAHRVLYYWHAVGNRILTTLSNMATNLNLTDMETCYKAFRREVLQEINIEENRFGFEPEITAKLSKLKLRIFEVAISYYGRTYGEGKKINWRDGISALRCILKYNFFR
jgi:glycosyltransferase involved in cell wall biosynthesis